MLNPLIFAGVISATVFANAPVINEFIDASNFVNDQIAFEEVAYEDETPILNDIEDEQLEQQTELQPNENLTEESLEFDEAKPNCYITEASTTQESNPFMDYVNKDVDTDLEKYQQATEFTSNIIEGVGETTIKAREETEGVINPMDYDGISM